MARSKKTDSEKKTTTSSEINVDWVTAEQLSDLTGFTLSTISRKRQELIQCYGDKANAMSRKEKQPQGRPRVMYNPLEFKRLYEERFGVVLNLDAEANKRGIEYVESETRVLARRNQIERARIEAKKKFNLKYYEHSDFKDYPKDDKLALCNQLISLYSSGTGSLVEACEAVGVPPGAFMSAYRDERDIQRMVDDAQISRQLILWATLEHLIGQMMLKTAKPDAIVEKIIHYDYVDEQDDNGIVTRKKIATSETKKIAPGKMPSVTAIKWIAEYVEESRHRLIQRPTENDGLDNMSFDELNAREQQIMDEIERLKSESEKNN